MSSLNLENVHTHLNQAPKASRSFGDLSAWFEMHANLTASTDNSIERAIIAGFNCEQLSFVFCGAYQSAMERMFRANRHKLAAFCHTEKGVQKPRDMHTSLAHVDANYHCSGTKHFVSGGQNAQSLYVSAIANDGATLKVFKLDAKEKGVGIEPSPSLPFLPELEHGTLTLERVLISETDILDGDGYTDYIKPFRTCEDLHILAALAAYRLKLAWQSLPHYLPHKNTAFSDADRENQIFVQSMLRQLLGIASLDQQGYSNPLMHLALEDTKQKFEDDLNKHEQTFAEQLPAAHATWQRDKMLLKLAEKAQSARTLSAWRALIS
jgi:hypothetical protein